jgi:uncharacterized membrane protein YkvA (DUF1232 family)
MWVLAGVLGRVVVTATIGVLAVAARLLPSGPLRELVGFVPNCIALLRSIRADGRLPARARLALGGALAYVVSPVQLIPNFLPVIGQIDDLIVVTWALRYACRRLPVEDIEAAWSGDPATLARLLGRPRSRLPDDPP